MCTLRALGILILALPAVAGEGLSVEPSSPRAKRQREEAHELWASVAPVDQLVREGKPVPPEQLREALATIAKAVTTWERALQTEWHAEANRELAEAVRAWFRLRAKLPPEPEPQTEDEKRDAEREAKRAHVARVRDVRKLIMDWGKARRATSLLRRCPLCSGRKEIRTAFGDRHACSSCSEDGTVPDREAIVEALWRYHGPLYRADRRNERDVDRALQLAGRAARSLAPFTQSVRIREVEDHDVWARVHVEEKVHDDPAARRFERVDKVYTLYRVGDQWYLYHPRYDRELVDVPEPEAEGEDRG